MQCSARIWESDRDSFSDFVGCNKRSALHRMFSFGGVNFSSSQELRELPTFGAITIAPYGFRLTRILVNHLYAFNVVGEFRNEVQF
jgi:hypothetical protein